MSVFLAYSSYNVSAFSQNFDSLFSDDTSNFESFVMDDSDFGNDSNDSNDSIDPFTLSLDPPPRALPKRPPPPRKVNNFTNNRRSASNAVKKIPFDQYNSYSVRRQYRLLNSYLNSFVEDYNRKNKFAKIGNKKSERSDNQNKPLTQNNNRSNNSDDVFSNLLDNRNKERTNSYNNNRKPITPPQGNRRNNNSSFKVTRSGSRNNQPNSNNNNNNFGRPNSSSSNNIEKAFNNERNEQLSQIQQDLKSDDVFSRGLDSKNFNNNNVGNRIENKQQPSNRNRPVFKESPRRTENKTNSNKLNNKVAQKNTESQKPVKTTKFNNTNSRTNTNSNLSDNNKKTTEIKTPTRRNNTPSKPIFRKTNTPNAKVAVKKSSNVKPKTPIKTKITKKPVIKKSAIAKEDIPIPKLRPYIQKTKPVKVASAKPKAKTKPASPSKSVNNKEYTSKPNPRLTQEDISFINSTLNNAYKALTTGQYPQSASLYKSVLRVDSNNEKALFGLATAYQKNRQYSLARQVYGKFLETNPKNKQAIDNFLYLVDKESTSMALDEVIKIERMNKEYAPIHAQIASLHAKSNNLVQAEQSYRKAVILDPNNLVYQYNLAIIYDKLGKITQSESLYRKLYYAHQDGRRVPGSIITLMERLNYLESMKRR